MGSPAASKDVTDFLAPYALEVRNLALAARSFVFKMIPDISEQVDAKTRIIGYGYGPKYADMVCMLMPTKEGVNLGVAYAINPNNPVFVWADPGKSILLSRTVNGLTNIWKYSLQDRSLTQVTFGPGPDTSPMSVPTGREFTT
jgi:hypothetical protein